MELTTNRFVLPNQWSVAKGKVKGSSREVVEINTYLDYLKHKVYEFGQSILREDKELSIQTMRQKWYATDEPKRTLMEAIGIHNEEMKCLVGKDFKKSTWRKYVTTERHIQDFIGPAISCNNASIHASGFDLKTLIRTTHTRQRGVKYAIPLFRYKLFVYNDIRDY